VTARAAVAAAALLAVLGAPAAAHAQLDGTTSSARGVTSQKRDVTFTVDSGGRVGDLVVEWDARCRNGTRFAPQTTTFDAPPEGAGRTIITGTGRYRVPERGGRIARVTAVISGRRSGPADNVAAQAWSGTLRIRAVMRRHGRLTDVCTLRTRWRARPQGFGAGTWEVRPDVPRPDGPPFYRRDPLPDTMAASGTRDAVTVESRSREAGSWSASFRAPALNRLEQGRTYTPTPGVSGGADMNVDDPSSTSCSDTSFTVQSIAFDELKRLVALRVSYVRDCGEGSGIWRGTIDWRASP
jgi:hypothetical protein